MDQTRTVVVARLIRGLRRRPLPAVLAVSVGLAAVVWAGPLQAWELGLTGLLQEWRGVRRPQVPVTIVAIDDFSLQQTANADLSGDRVLKQLGNLPWPRWVQALLLERLYRAGARAVAIDLLFDQPSARGPADDRSLAEALRRHRPRTVLAAQVVESSGSVAGLTLSPPLATLQAAAGDAAVGLLNGSPEADGAIRRRPGDHADELDRLLGSVPEGLGKALLLASGLPDRVAGPLPLPLGRWQPLLEMHGPPGTIPTLPVWNLLEPGAYRQLLASGRLRGQLVLVGPTAAIAQDLHRGPFAGSEGMPGVALHATELANRLEGRAFWFWRPGRFWPLVLALVTLLVALAAERLERPLQRFSSLAGAAIGLGLLAMLLASWLGVAVQLFSVAAVTLLVGVVSTADATTRLQWQRRRLRSALERYLSPAVAAEIANQPSEADGLLGGRSAEVVVMLADIRGFTQRTRTMSQAGHARELVHQLNAYLSEAVAAIHAEEGTVDKFIGDATLAVFGAPLNRGSAAEAAAALRAALDLQARLRALNQRWQAEGLEPWAQIIVLNFGRVISGNIGASSRMEYTVIGDAVNATSRLEAVAKERNRDLVMTSAFVELLGGTVPLEDLGEVHLRGVGATGLWAIAEVADSVCLP